MMKAALHWIEMADAKKSQALRGSGTVHLEVVRKFVSDDIATPEDIAAIEAGMKEYAAGETISHADIDWN